MNVELQLLLKWHEDNGRLMMFVVLFVSMSMSFPRMAEALSECQ